MRKVHLVNSVGCEFGSDSKSIYSGFLVLTSVDFSGAQEPKIKQPIE